MNDLFHFLADMAINPRLQETFENDPGAVLEAVALSNPDRKALRSRDKAKIATAFVDGLLTSELVAVMGGCYYTDPGPDPLPDPDPLPEPPEEN